MLEPGSPEVRQTPCSQGGVKNCHPGRAIGTTMGTVDREHRAQMSGVGSPQGSLPRESHTQPGFQMDEQESAR